MMKKTGVGRSCTPENSALALNEKVSKILGHKSVEVTSSHYSHLVVEDTREALNAEGIG